MVVRRQSFIGCGIATALVNAAVLLARHGSFADAAALRGLALPLQRRCGSQLHFAAVLCSFASRPFCAALLCRFVSRLRLATSFRR